MDEEPTAKNGKNSLMPRAADLANIARGLVMGSADIVPGVSGGTMALILGIYERLVLAISHIDRVFLGHLRKKQWQAAAEHMDLRFLITLGCGIGLGVVGLATLMNWLLEFHIEPTLAAFFGLILASSWIVARSIDRWNVLRVLFAIVGAAFAYWLVGQPFMKGVDGYPYLFLCGMIAICAMILPGISGAFILLVLGKYYDITGIIKGMVHGQVTVENLLVVVVFGSGCVVGLLAFSKFLRWLLAHFHAQTMAVLCGFMLGSLRRIWPFKEFVEEVSEKVKAKNAEMVNVWPDSFDGDFWLAVGLAVAAFVLVVTLEYIGYRFSKRK
ncbi:MAG: DUF368 domain-containing protein [Planctomycetia bacterium]|jgi:putative membrane protein